jgi:alpha-beta hydrolase superfamily lysophospholipase
MLGRVTFQTEDDVTIVGDFYQGAEGGSCALLLHMMPATRESWSVFAESMRAAGFSCLAIDLRGHGESVMRGGQRIDYKLFSDAEQQEKIRDVEAAVRWLATVHGVSEKRLVLVGASIGANLAIAYAASHQDIPAVVALSPGLDYRGVKTLDATVRLSSNQSLFLAASEEDEYSYLTNQALSEKKRDAIKKEYRAAGHGTSMFHAEPSLMEDIAAWLKDRVR